MIALMAGAISGAISALTIEHGGAKAVVGIMLVLAILIFCAVMPFPERYDG